MCEIWRFIKPYVKTAVVMAIWAIAILTIMACGFITMFAY